MTAGDVLSNDLCCELLLERLAIALAGSTATPTSAGPVAAAPAATIDFAAEMFFLASDLTSVCYGLGSRDNMSVIIVLLDPKLAPTPEAGGGPMAAAASSSAAGASS